MCMVGLEMHGPEREAYLDQRPSAEAYWRVAQEQER